MLAKKIQAEAYPRLTQTSKVESANVVNDEKAVRRV